MLIVLAGLPGTGKTTIARKLAAQRAAVHGRIDSLEQALMRAGIGEADIGEADIGAAGYVAGYAVAADNLQVGLSVIADSVNPLAITRDAWRNVALEAGVPIVEVELICTDTVEHRRRLAARTADIPGHALPEWKDVLARQYAPWSRDHHVFDTATMSVDQVVQAIINRLPATRGVIDCQKRRQDKTY